MITAQLVVATARTWLGTRWRHQACLKHVGTDCIHFIAGVAREVGVTTAQGFFADAALHNYGRTPDPGMLYAACDQLMERVDTESRALADVLVIRFGRHPTHFAFVSQTQPLRMIHAWARARQVVEHGLEEPWVSRIARVYRLPGVTWAN